MQKPKLLLLARRSGRCARNYARRYSRSSGPACVIQTPRHSLKADTSIGRSRSRVGKAVSVWYALAMFN